MSKILEKLRKIRELAERGSGGERDNAIRKLDELLKKHGLTHEEVFKEEPEKHWVGFFHKDKWHLSILKACYFAMTQKTILEYKRLSRHVSCIELSAWEAVELTHMYSYYKKMWNQQLDEVSIAFIIKHRLFVDSPGDEKSEPMDEEERNRIRLMIHGMKDGKFISTKRMLKK